MEYSNLSTLLSKAFLSEGSWLPKVRDKGTRTQLSMMSHIRRILPYLLVAVLSTDTAGRENNFDPPKNTKD